MAPAEWSSWGWPDPQPEGHYYQLGSLASSCGLPELKDYMVFLSPTCGAAGLDAATENDGWFEIALVLQDGYSMAPADLGAVSISIGTDHFDAQQNLVCGGANPNCYAATPEPASLLLLGIGLSGLGALVARRRRRGE